MFDGDSIRRVAMDPAEFMAEAYDRWAEQRRARQGLTALGRRWVPDPCETCRAVVREAIIKLIMAGDFRPFPK